MGNFTIQVLYAMNDSDLKIIVALAAAIASVLVSLISFVSMRSNQRDIEKLKAKLADSKSEADAKRDYTYEALKRLYSQYEPIRFHLVEACESSQELIAQLAKIASTDEVGDIGRFPRGNYLRISRVYHLLLPAVYFKIVQTRLTLIDLEASRSTFLQYLLAKQIYVLFTRDSEIADFFSLVYTPYVQGWRELRSQNPQRYRRQGFTTGRLENTLSIFLKSSSDELPNILSFGEFETLISSTDQPNYNSPLGAAMDLFDEFDPITRPVLWRMLLAQSILHALFIRSVRSNVENTDDLRKFADQLTPQLSMLTESSELACKIIQFVKSTLLSHIDHSFKTPSP